MLVAIVVMLLLFFPNPANCQPVRSQVPFDKGISGSKVNHTSGEGSSISTESAEAVKELPLSHKGVSLEECIAEAVARSPNLVAARRDIAAAQYEIAKKRATTLSFIDAEVAGYELYGSPATPFAALNLFEPENGIRFNRSAHWGPVATQSIAVNYPLFQYGSLMGLNNAPVVGAAKAIYEQQKLQAVIAEQQIVLNGIAPFVSAVWYARETELDQAVADLNHKRLYVISQEVALGLKLPQDAELALTELEGSERRLESSRQDALEWRYQPAALLGRPSDGETRMLDGALPPLSPLPPLNRFLGQVMTSHPALRVQGEKIEVAREQYRIDRSTLLPTAALGTSLTAA